MREFVFFAVVAWISCASSHESDHRIINGTEAPQNGFPWMIALRLNFLNIIYRDCAGVLISDTFLLTAASCFRDVDAFKQYFTIQAGVHQLNAIDTTEVQTRALAHLIIHPNYTADPLQNDIALVRVSVPFDLRKTGVATIPLSNTSALEGLDLIAIGWGVQNAFDLSTVAHSLQQVTVQENVPCKVTPSIDPTTQLCAVGTCLGDTGGPLMLFFEETQRYELVGIISVQADCKTEGLFTRVAPYIEWISDILENPPPTPPPLPTIAPTSATASTTTQPEVLGPPIPFFCDTRHSCGCSSVPVVFHDELPSARIVGGETAQAHSWSWTVSLRMEFFGHSCAGTIVNEEWILTAAHCITPFAAKVHIGVYDERLPSPQIRDVVETIVHPDYVPPPKFINDIALLRVSPPINFLSLNGTAGLACLPSQRNDDNYPPEGTPLAVIGWGRLASGGSRPTQLRQVRVQALANDDWRCRGAIYDTDRQFCAMVDGGGKDACQGDSGGPIHQWLGDHWEQVGIVSYGTGCALAAHPGVYTRLSFYTDWIRSMVNRNNGTGVVSTTTPTTATTTSAFLSGSTTYNAADIIHHRSIFLLFTFLPLLSH